MVGLGRSRRSVVATTPDTKKASDPSTRLYDAGPWTTEDQVQAGLALFLRLKNPAQMPALMATIVANTQVIDEALTSLNYVHFARFQPTPDYAYLAVITEYDGDLESYLMDFVAVLGDQFNAILEFIQDAPRLPVQSYPQDFCTFVGRNNLAVPVWSAYPQKTVLDIQRGRPQPQKETGTATSAALDLDDIQGNILRGYHMDLARHFQLQTGSALAAKQFLAALVSGDATANPQLTTAAHWKARPHYCLNLGLTWDGLKGLGLPAGILAQFPPSFQGGPVAAQATLHDFGDSDPANWIVGGPNNPPIDMMVSLFSDTEKHLEQTTRELMAMFSRYALIASVASDAKALPDGEVHFGYRDGIAQPQIAGTPGRLLSDMQPRAEPGEFLLGKDYVNQYHGNFLGDLPGALGDNGTYAAFRLLRQDVRGFHEYLAEAAATFNMDPKEIAAKLMGRWPNGTPLSLSPETDATLSPSEINNFDYAPTPEHPTFYDDHDGLRCPVGAHIRRLNPRGSVVMGKQYSRRLVRRGMAYGPAFDPAAPDDGIERGLAGLFICGDLASQFEFIQDRWANIDMARSGLRATRDGLIGSQLAAAGTDAVGLPCSQPAAGRFVIRTTDLRDPIVLTHLPTWVTTRGSAYLFLPGIGGIKHLAAL